MKAGFQQALLLFESKRLQPAISLRKCDKYSYQSFAVWAFRYALDCVSCYSREERKCFMSLSDLQVFSYSPALRTAWVYLPADFDPTKACETLTRAARWAKRRNLAIIAIPPQTFEDTLWWGVDFATDRVLAGKAPTM